MTQKSNFKQEYKDNNPIRLNKFIADSGISSRRKADEMIRKGLVKVNGKIVTELGTKVFRSDFITVAGDPISISTKNVYIVLNKPKDTISTTDDDLNRKTVMDIVKSKFRIYPVGRLDRNTTGVLLFTNDGELANRLMHPKYKVVRQYQVELDKPVSLSNAKGISEGVELEEGKTAPCNVFVNPKDHRQVHLELIEGKYREIRRMFEKFGYQVKKLNRKMYANISTTGLPRGKFRHLTSQEVQQLKNRVGLK
jgi:23S rRNA pseudouridine2605 synthase